MIIGNKVLLRAIEEEDLPVIYKWSSNSEIKELFHSNLKYINYDEYVKENYDDSQENHGFVIVEAETKKPVGVCKLIGIDFINKKCLCTLYIGDVNSREKGYGTEAMKLLMKFAFEDINLNRIGLWVFDFNKRAIKSYKKCGMKVEGIVREGLYRDGKYHDIYLMGILRSEYHELVKGENQ